MALRKEGYICGEETEENHSGKKRKKKSRKKRKTFFCWKGRLKRSSRVAQSPRQNTSLMEILVIMNTGRRLLKKKKKKMKGNVTPGYVWK
jgi:hypothetical protein